MVGRDLLISVFCALFATGVFAPVFADDGSYMAYIQTDSGSYNEDDEILEISGWTGSAVRPNEQTALIKVTNPDGIPFGYRVNLTSDGFYERQVDLADTRQVAGTYLVSLIYAGEEIAETTFVFEGAGNDNASEIVVNAVPEFDLLPVATIAFAAVIGFLVLVRFSPLIRSSQNVGNRG